jgi:CheY-like chemotaxis protein
MPARFPAAPSGVLVGISPFAGADSLPRLPEGMPALRILIVDDDAPVRKACCEIASGMGLVPFAAGSVPEALAALERQRVDMLLLDLKLPGGGGLQLLQEVKLSYPEIGVVVMTAFATVSSAVEAMRIGAGDYLTKPFALEDLTGVLDRSSRRLHIRCGEPQAARAPAHPDRDGQPDRPLPGDGEGLPHHVQSRLLPPPGADPGRERHRQGAQRRPALHSGRLRVAGSHPDRE